MEKHIAILTNDYTDHTCQIGFSKFYIDIRDIGEESGPSFREYLESGRISELHEENITLPCDFDKIVFADEIVEQGLVQL